MKRILAAMVASVAFSCGGTDEYPASAADASSEPVDASGEALDAGHRDSGWVDAGPQCSPRGDECERQADCCEGEVCLAGKVCGCVEHSRTCRENWHCCSGDCDVLKGQCR